MTLPRLHAVTDDRVLALPDFEERARALALGPAVALHVRTRADGRRQLALTERVRGLVADTGTWVVVSDRADVALLAGAQAVQLPESGLPVGGARRLGVGTVGQSVHTADAAAASDADWVFLGPIWTTTSHPGRPALGPAVLTGAGRRVVAIGGITSETAREARACGAWGVAAISALWHAPDPAAAARAFLLSFEE